MKEIANKVYYVGVNDRHKTHFEGLWPLPYGVSYNSYLIKDKNKICLIDTVEVDFFMQFLNNLREVIGDSPIDYVVINHMEPDHSSSLALLKKYYPEIKLVGNKKTFEMVAGFYGIKEDTLEVKNGTSLSLGDYTLKFYLTPMVHWPETMVTCCEGPSNFLFTGDAFGAFGALNGAIVDDDMDTEMWWDEMVRYYSNIVGKYGLQVQNALKKIADLSIEYICSTHGPVWHKEANKVIEIYDHLSKYETNNGLVICYGSMYGNTEQMAELIAEGASKTGLKTIKIHNVSKIHHSYIIKDIFKYRGLIMGAPTYNAGIFHDMESLLSEIENRDIKNHYLGYFGSFAWAQKSVKILDAWAEKNKYFEVVGEPVTMKLGVSPEIREKCLNLGKEMANRLLN
jgi:metallo-beta-lactamase domain protein